MPPASSYGGSGGGGGGIKIRKNMYGYKVFEILKHLPYFYLFFFSKNKSSTESTAVDPNQRPHSAASDQGLPFLPLYLL